MSMLHRANDLLARTTGLEVRRVGADGVRPQSDSAPGRWSSDTAIPPARIPAGEAVASGFFGTYPRFLETSRAATDRRRLDLRYEAICAQNRDVLEGARVLDLACHDGRWSFAALQCGASEVIGIEGRPELVAKAEETFAAYDVGADRYRFVAGDIFATMAEQAPRVDVVMCLGFLYHTLRYNELFSRIAATDPKYLIIDTQVIPRPEPLVELEIEGTKAAGNAIADEFSLGNRVLSGRPSKAGVEMMCHAYGFEIHRYSDWAALLRDNAPSGRDRGNWLRPYARGERITLTARSGRASQDAHER